MPRIGTLSALLQDLWTCLSLRAREQPRQAAYYDLVQNLCQVETEIEDNGAADAHASQCFVCNMSEGKESQIVECVGLGPRGSAKVSGRGGGGNGTTV